MTSTGNDELTAEVARVAAAFQSWFGDEPDAHDALDRIAAAFHPDFVTVTPDGALHHREGVLARLAGARGAKGAGFRIAIEDVRALPSPGPGLSLVTYLERQGDDLRRSTALLRDEAPRWLMVHESWVAGDGQAAPAS